MIELIVIFYIVWAIISLGLCIWYDPERLLNDYGKGIYIFLTLPWQILGWIYEPIRRIKFKIQKRMNKKKGKHGYGYKEEDKFDYKW